MEILGKIRNKLGEPLLCHIINLSMMHLDLIDTLLSLGLPMYEAISEGNEFQYFHPDDKMYQVAGPLDLTFIRHKSQKR